VSDVVDLVKRRRDPDLIAVVEVWREVDGTLRWDGSVTARTELRASWAIANAVKAIGEYATSLGHRHNIPTPIRRRRHRVRRR
jgi:hypothetical protein